MIYMSIEVDTCPLSCISGDTSWWQDIPTLAESQDITGNFYFKHVSIRVLTWMSILRILASYEVKTAKISNFWTFLPKIQLIIHLFKDGILTETDCAKFGTHIVTNSFNPASPT